MISDFKGKTAVLTGGASGFGLECARIGASLGMNVVLVDVQKDALKAAHDEIKAMGAQVMAKRVDVSNADEMQELATAVFERFGAPHFVFNNAGVGAGGLVWESSVKDWEWLLGVNVWGVIHGVRLFTPMILTETLYQDLKLVSEQISASVLCPYFVPTGINQSERNRPSHLPPVAPTKSQLIGQAMSDKAVGSGKVSAAQVAQMVFDAMKAEQFYIYSHPKALGNAQTRFDAIVHGSNPPDPFAERPDIGIKLKDSLRS